MKSGVLGRAGGGVNCYYEPENNEELQELCRGFLRRHEAFDLIGHTSNTLYMPNYSVERMVSIRKLNNFNIGENCIQCECGVPVKTLAKAAIEAGIKGYEGLVDLPGTVAGAIYGNAGCYGCSLSNLLIEAVVLTNDGELVTVDYDWFLFTRRSSALKRKEKEGIILSMSLRAERGNKEKLVRKAEKNHIARKQTQPAPQGTLGSVFSDEGEPTLLNRVISYTTKIYEILLKVIGTKDIDIKRKHLTFRLLQASDVEPYIHHWNCYWWRDENAHELFWKYVRLHRMMFTKSVFEIEIKHNPNFKIP